MFSLSLISVERIKKDTQDVCKKAKLARLQKSQTRDEKVVEARLNQWKAEERRTRLPRNIISETATEIQRRFGLFQEDFSQNHAHYVLNREEKGYTFSLYKSLLKATFDNAWEEELEKPTEELTSAEGATTAGASQADLDTKDLRVITLPLSRIVRKDISIEDLDESLLICTQLHGILSDPDHTTSLYHKAQVMLEVMDNDSYVCSMVKETLEANGDTTDLATKIQEMLDRLQAPTDPPTHIRDILETKQAELSLFMEDVCIGAYKMTLWVSFLHYLSAMSSAYHHKFMSTNVYSYIHTRLALSRRSSRKCQIGS